MASCTEKFELSTILIEIYIQFLGIRGLAQGFKDGTWIYK